MVQFNLLPDVKLQYIKTRRMKRIVTIVSLTVAVASVIALVLVFVSVQVAQKKHLANLNKDIAKEVKTLNSVEDLNKILTVQNQLKSLPGLYDDRKISSRIFGYISQLTPAAANISSFKLDMNGNTVSIAGTADGTTTINQYADTLKFVTYTTTAVKEEDQKRAFSNVVTNLALTDKKTTFVINASFDPVLFDGKETPVIKVPKIISTRSETEKPQVFKEGSKQ